MIGRIERDDHALIPAEHMPAETFVTITIMGTSAVAVETCVNRVTSGKIDGRRS